MQLSAAAEETVEMKAGKVLAIGIVGLIGAWFAWGLLKGLLGAVFSLIVPAAIVIGAVYVIYRLTGGDKALPGSRRSLP